MKNSIGLRCHHKCCTDCYREYLTKAIMDDGATESIYCPAEGCNKVVDSDFITHVITDPDVRQKYKRLMMNNFVQVRFIQIIFTANGLTAQLIFLIFKFNFQVRSMSTLVHGTELSIGDSIQSIGKIGLRTELHVPMWSAILLQLRRWLPLPTAVWIDFEMEKAWLQ